MWQDDGVDFQPSAGTGAVFDFGSEPAGFALGALMPSFRRAGFADAAVSTGPTPLSAGAGFALERVEALPSRAGLTVSLAAGFALRDVLAGETAVSALLLGALALRVALGAVSAATVICSSAGFFVGLFRDGGAAAFVCAAGVPVLPRLF
jgi:sorbitol-specific phosphotransferase system component IIC